jgi:thioredoxin reductase
MDDVIIIGGSFAGLASALQLGRARRKVTVLDTGHPSCLAPIVMALKSPTSIGALSGRVRSR